jgi:hypothetical protein
MIDFIVLGGHRNCIRETGAQLINPVDVLRYSGD